MVVVSMRDLQKAIGSHMRIIQLYLLILPAYLSAQIDLPPASPDASWTHQLGFTKIELQYSRPHMRSRKIFGSLVPYGVLWRTGAGESTRITFSEDITLGGEHVKKGKYAIYSIPGPDEWIIILNTDATLHGDFGYDEKKDALRFKVKPLKSDAVYESFTIELLEFTPDHKATLEMKWENTVIKIPIDSHADSNIMRQIDLNLVKATSDNPALLYKAAQYYYTARKDLNQALKWVENAVALSKENFDYSLLNTKILVALNRYPEALSTAQRALELGKKANRAEDVWMLSKDIEEWKIQEKNK